MSRFEKRENPQLEESYLHLTHESGLEIYVIPKRLSTYFASVTVKYGSIDSRFRLDGQEMAVPDGIAHFLEHKMFESEDGTDAFARYGAVGADANAFTSFTRTSYIFSCTDRFYDSLEILLEMVSHPHFTQENVAKEQGIIGEEIGMMNDNPGWVILFDLLGALYRDHSVRIPIAGSVQSISGITPEILHTCYDAFYRPSNMILAVSGDIDPERVEALVDKYFPAVPPKQVDRIYAQEQPGVVSKRVEAVMDVARPIFMIGCKDTDISPDPIERARKSARLTILLDAMFGPSSPIYSELYEQGLITGTLSHEYEHTAAFSFAQISGQSAQAEQAIDKIMAYIDKTVQDGLDPELFERAKRVSCAQNIRSFDSTEEIVGLFTGAALEDIEPFRLVDAFSAVTKEECDALAAGLFAPGSRAISLVKPGEEE